MAKKIQREMPVIERIRDWLNDETGRVKLHDGDETVWGRLQILRSLLTENAYSVNDALPVMQKSTGISEATFWRDVRGLFSLFGDIMISNREGRKYLLSELNMKTFQMAAKKEDPKAMAAAVKNMITLEGFDREEVEVLDIDRLKPFVVTVLDEDTRQVLNRLREGDGVIDLTEIVKNGASTRHGGTTGIEEAEIISGAG